MNTMFLVVKLLDDDSVNLFVTSNGDLADAFIEQEQAKDDEFACIVAKMNAFLKKWYDDNPMPRRDNKAIEDIKAEWDEWDSKLEEAKEKFLISIGQSPDLTIAISTYPGKSIYCKQIIEHR